MINIAVGGKKNIMFIKPPLVTDAVWDPIRTCPYLGIAFLASGLKLKGHRVRYLDEVVRKNGLSNQELFIRELDGEKAMESSLDVSYSSFKASKMEDYWKLSPKKFVEKYTAFPKPGVVSRTLVRTGTRLEDTLAEIESEMPDIIGIPLIATANYLPATNLAKSIRDRFPQIKIIFGGQHISALPDLFFSENKDYFDHIVVGDANGVIDDIVNGRIGDKIINGGVQPLRDFPILDPTLLDENDYPIIPTYTPPTDGRKTIDFMFTKGCFRDCAFCLAGQGKGDRVTAMEFDRLDKQLKLFKESGIEELVVQDDAFLWKPNSHLPEVLKLMKKYGFYWQNNGGVEFESLSDDVVKQFIDYNSHGDGKVTALYIPFNPRNWNRNESASSSMSAKYENRLNSLKRLREEAGIYVFTSAIVGTPEQTVEMFEDELATDRKLIQRGYLDAALCLSATMLPGTEWYKSNGHNIINPKDYYGFSLFTTHDRTEHLEPRQIEEFMIRWTKELSDVQKTYNWGTAFPNPELVNLA